MFSSLDSSSELEVCGESEYNHCQLITISSYTEYLWTEAGQEVRRYLGDEFSKSIGEQTCTHPAD